MSKSDPVLVFYKSTSCGYCVSLARIWGDESNGPNTVKKLVGAAFPNLRFQTVTTPGGPSLNEKEYPSGLIAFAKWFPMILLVPGPRWNEAMAHLGPNNPISLIEGTQVMNAVWKNGKLEYVGGFDSTKAEGILAWVRHAINQPDFKRAQAGLDPLPALPQMPSLLSPPPTDSICSLRVVSRPAK